MPDDFDINAFNQQVIDEFRANDGRVSGSLADARLILLTTTGARTGARRTHPVVYAPGEDGRIILVASAWGRSADPAWFHNLAASSRVTVEDGVRTYDVAAKIVEEAERDAIFARAVESNPGWAEYQAQTTRVIPVVVLQPID